MDPETCTHPKVTPKVTDDELRGLSPSEVREKYPRFYGECPDCKATVIAYGSYMHYLMGDW